MFPFHGTLCVFFAFDFPFPILHVCFLFTVSILISSSEQISTEGKYIRYQLHNPLLCHSVLPYCREASIQPWLPGAKRVSMTSRTFYVLSDKIHPDLLENGYVFTSYMELVPENCLVLVEDGGVCGYVVSHPSRRHHPSAPCSLVLDIASISRHDRHCCPLPKLRFSSSNFPPHGQNLTPLLRLLYLNQHIAHSVRSSPPSQLKDQRA